MKGLLQWLLPMMMSPDAEEAEKAPNGQVSQAAVRCLSTLPGSYSETWL